MLFTYLSTVAVTPMEQLGKIVKNLVKTWLSQSPRKGLITLNETMQKLFTYVLYGLLLNIANKNVKNEYEKIFKLRENKACNEKYKKDSSCHGRITEGH